ncbi:24283_t:CDS:2 [Racocetra persica]|uniref:24283_t:CDS:1 n=1 Tax=Racocetra persica TaxID=160502 RepID=A0ACA9MRF9_9GLOM|nr:24283_t:CDS:2 [Racocetra persica]
MAKAMYPRDMINSKCDYYIISNPNFTLDQKREILFHVNQPVEIPLEEFDSE